MSAVFDILLLVIVLIFIIVGGKKGLIRSVSGFLCYIFAFNFSNYFYTFIMKYTDKIGFIAEMKNTEYASEAEELIIRDDGFLTHISDIVKKLFSFKDVLLGDSSSLTGGEASLTAESVEAAAEAAKKELEAMQGRANFMIGDAVSTLFSFIGLLIVSILVFKLITVLIDSLIKNTPGLKQLNGLLGAVFGVLCGLFWTWVTAKVFVSFLFPFLNAKFPLVFPAEMITSTIVTVCLKLNPLYFLMLFTKWFASLFH